MKVLMVCLGNICRSPLAHGILRAKTKELGWEIDSAGTSAFHAGEGPDPRSVAIARRYNVNIRDLESRQFDPIDFENFDLIYAMDQSNYDNILKLAPNDETKQKVKLILNEITPGENNEVPDPYYGGEHGFEIVYQMLNEATDKIVEKYG
ncbi:MAG: low molecular weight phosphotyrosine protein phosphatase [Schleiferiaceae bacterium]|nr:low molecular weight phosphotyrosine protein phosphatase [Schleiferiaceae bacterium]